MGFAGSVSRDDTAPATRSVRDAFDGWVDRVLASPRFQAWAARFPLTRPVARARAAALFDLVAGFTYSQVLAACVRLELFDRLLEGPMTSADLARGSGLDVAAMERLLAAAVALRLVERRRRGHYGLGRLGAPLAGNAAVKAMVAHHADLYADLADPIALLASHGPGARMKTLWPYADGSATTAPDADAVRRYSALMTASQPLVAGLVLDAYRFGAHRKLLDVGGGEGAFAIAAARACPSLEAIVFDLPAVVDRARSRIVDAGLASRVRVQAGDFKGDALPGDADLATLVRVLHDHDDAPALAILRNLHRALAPGATVLVAEPMAGTRGAERMGDAYFGLYLLAMGSGRPRTADELAAMLLDAGFSEPRTLRTTLPIQTRVMVARR